ncbi:mechanosensitive ion channel family protein [Candidatus Altiarchaeota archaeon]
MNIQTVFEFLTPYLPNLISVLFVLILTHFILRSLNKILYSIYRKFNLPRSYFLHVRAFSRILIYIIATFLILLAVPGVNEKVIAIVGIGIGLMVSLSSTNTIGNAVAGAIIYLTRPIHEGDRIEIDGVLGDVVSLELLFVHVKTIKDEIISIPALHVLKNKIVNYSQLDQVILYVSITLGYDLDPGLVEELLIESIEASDDILKDPKPFVLINNLNDYTIDYEVNGYTDKPHLMINTKSNIRRNIITHFTRAGVQIMSPAYVNIKQRSGVDKMIPEQISYYFEKECIPQEEKDMLVQKVVEAKKKLEEKKKKDIKIERQ